MRSVLSSNRAETAERQVARPPTSGLVWIPGGTFTMGSNRHYPEEAPAHRVTVDGFWMDSFPVTNAEFRHFVEATGHVTFAELVPDPSHYPGARPEMLYAGSLVFTKPRVRVDLGDSRHWWSFARGAQWRHPRGASSTLAGLDNHPVVHVTYGDAVAYATWAGKALPTEAEWELAARGRLEGAEYAWGDELTPGGCHLANTWQGEFPWENGEGDGFEFTSPVDAFPPNVYGVHDMIGNTWEWTADWYRPRHSSDQLKSCCIPRNPRGGKEEHSYDPRDATHIPRKVLKGGSHLCAPNYCRRYRPAARFPEPIDTSACHVGFRCVSRGPRGESPALA